MVETDEREDRVDPVSSLQESAVTARAKLGRRGSWPTSSRLEGGAAGY